MNKEVKTISPFKNFCMTIGALPTSYLESMSYYETLCWLCKYLENTINPAINNNAEALEELQEYVANYFDNLDVTEEINDKLDEMAENGTLAQIINVEMIGTLSNLTTTDKSNLVNAINEVKTVDNEMIGTLSNLTTTDKSNLVNAINEVKAVDNIDLVHIHSVSENEIVTTGTINDFYQCYVVWSDNSKWFKFFCDFTAAAAPDTATFTIPLPQGFVVTETYQIRNAGVYTIDGALYGNMEITVAPSGISFIYGSSTPVRVTANPYLYYNGAIEI